MRLKAICPVLESRYPFGIVRRRFRKIRVAALNELSMNLECLIAPGAAMPGVEASYS